VKILFLGRHYTYFRNFESVLRELAARGHAIHLGVERDEAFGGLAMVQALASEFPSITYGEAPGRADDDWSWVVNRLRLGLDYLRYQHPVFDTARKLRDRSRDRTPGLFVALGNIVRVAGGWLRQLTSAVLRAMERAVPEDPAIRIYLEAQKPDVMLLTPLIDLGSSQVEYLRAARAVGIPTGLCVWSWDHLSSKALIRETPDRVFVWNPTQKHEAITLHGVPEDRVVVTGAQCFDQWFDRQPSRDRETFCREVGLPVAPYVLWVCSALFQGSPSEAQFVLQWIRALRDSGSPRLRTVPVLVRPHPSRLAEWDGVDVSALNAVVRGGNPIDARSRADYFDTLYHSAAVVGINTSAFIEAGIVGRPVHAIVVPEMADNQTGTVHFNYLVSAGGGLLEVAHSFEDHLTKLVASLSHASAGVKPFVRAFVRPHGLATAATPCFVDGVESMRSVQPQAPRHEALAPLWRWMVTRAARLRDDERYERWVLSSREVASLEQTRAARAVKAHQRAAARRQHHDERLHAEPDVQARNAVVTEQRLAEKRPRIDAHPNAKIS
jgi:hypothetical protein